MAGETDSFENRVAPVKAGAPGEAGESFENRLTRVETGLAKIEAELAAIQVRNFRVAADKGWEVSGYRRLTIGAITYFVAAVLLRLLGSEDFLTNAMVPAAGYILSTMTLPWAKQRWIARRPEQF